MVKLLDIAKLVEIISGSGGDNEIAGVLAIVGCVSVGGVCLDHGVHVHNRDYGACGGGGGGEKGEVVRLLVGGCGRVVGVHVWRQWSSWIWL